MTIGTPAATHSCVVAPPALLTTRWLESISDGMRSVQPSTSARPSTARYEIVAADGRARDEAWWRAASALWMAAREYCRRHAQSDAVATRLKKHGTKELSEISVEYELELSARMALRQALAGYLAIRPEAA